MIAADEEADLALIAVEGKNLPTIPLGDSDAVVIGQRVLAIGNPLGLQNSVSEGIVSGIREASNQKWIQTTAAASPGISGGPLVNSYGEAIGVVTFKLRGENLNFASGIGRARRLMETPTTTQQPLKLSASIGSGLWTSLVTGSDYKVRVDGEYIYTEWVNLPSALQGTAAFSRSELRRVSGAWRGKTRARMPCTYQRLLEPPQVNWCSVENDIEIQSISSSRVEGRAFAPTKVDCRKCQVKASEWKSFAWIPKD